jgi:hypothetical protein
MPSDLHELLLLLFRKRAASALDLMRELKVQLPEYDEVRADSSELNTIQPVEYQADLVLLLLQKTRTVLGVIVEVQLGRDEDKPYKWPVYVANLRARHRCPVCLLVLSVKTAVARWAGRSIDLGPGTRCTPWVVGPSNTPAITDLKEARQNVELAVFSAVEHARNTDSRLVSRIASAAIVASASLDDERSRLYFDLIVRALSKNTRRLAMSSLEHEYEYKSDFARRYVAKGKVAGRKEGKAEGRAEGRVEVVLKLLTFRFGPLPEEVQTRVRGVDDEQFDALAERVVTARTLEEVL